MLEALSSSLHVWEREREGGRERECVVCIFFSSAAAAASTSCLSTLTTTKLIGQHTHARTCVLPGRKSQCVCASAGAFILPNESRKIWEEKEEERERERGGRESGENGRVRGIFVCRWSTPIWNRLEGFCCEPLKRTKIIPKSAFIWERRKREKNQPIKEASQFSKKHFFLPKKNFAIFHRHTFSESFSSRFVTFHHTSSHRHIVTQRHTSRQSWIEALKKTSVEKSEKNPKVIPGQVWRHGSSKSDFCFYKIDNFRPMRWLSNIELIV